VSAAGRSAWTSSTSTDPDIAAVAATGPPGDLVAVGRVGAPRGLRGDVFVEPWTDSPDERFVPGAVLYTNGKGVVTVADAYLSGGKQVVHFREVDDRDAAAALRDTQLFIPAASRPALADPDEFYDSDLVGLAVHHADGASVGTVTDVAHTSSAAYLVVDVDGREWLIPFVRAIVPSVDLAAGRVVIDPPEGLLEL
jgi:16S rRNA processing protein RimM